VIVGTVGCKGPPRDGEVEVGYGLVPSAFGMGYATTAVRAIVDAAARRDDIDRVVAHTQAGAEASIAVLERAGFEPDGPGNEPGLERHVRRLRGA
jgi:[ribosomal protein S5]-alanine N-acetyltransferase